MFEAFTQSPVTVSASEGVRCSRGSARGLASGTRPPHSSPGRDFAASPWCQALATVSVVVRLQAHKEGSGKE